VETGNRRKRTKGEADEDQAGVVEGQGRKQTKGVILINTADGKVETQII